MFWLRKILRMDIHPSSRVSLKARLDFTNPHGIHIDEGSYVAFGATILSHDMARVTHFDTYIGKNCFIGANSIVLPGVMIGDQCIVAAGCVVTKDVPSHSLVVGNPGKIIKTDIRTKKWGILVESFDSHALLPDG
jgi:acetyltransferase-like isoleucine patch superfamily enzyme